MAKFLPVFIVACGFQMTAIAQENSPYSRYGLGDLAPNHNIFSRGMGGIAAGILDYQSINFVNPATLASLPNTIFDIGSEVDVRRLKSTNPAKTFTSTNALFSYLQLFYVALYGYEHSYGFFAREPVNSSDDAFLYNSQCPSAVLYSYEDLFLDYPQRYIRYQ